MKKILPFLILLSALSVSGSAAFYSVYGLSKLFAGASTQVIIMASSLEVSKLVIATLLHEYWNRLNILLKSYLTLAVVVLVMITSAGIYGFLSSAYQETANLDMITTREIELVDTKQKIYIDSKNELSNEKDLVIQSISELRKSLSNPNQVQYTDRAGNLITTTSSAGRAAIESQLSNAIATRDELTTKIQIATDSITRYEIQKIELINNSESSSELGPLKYISNISGLELDIIVNYFLLLIIFVFDPLAISLVLAANFAFKQLKSKSDTIPAEITQIADEPKMIEEIEPQPQPESIEETEPIEEQTKKTKSGVEKIYNTIQKKKQARMT
jgi:hypothetical protein